MYRQGDILIEKTDGVPREAVKQKPVVIASSDTTGYRHKIKDRRSARLYTAGGRIYLEVVKDSAELVHPEHDTIVLKRGVYRVWRQREYTEQGPRNVVD